MDTNSFNKQAYESGLAVRDFGSEQSLQRPEEAILNILAPHLSTMTMLDIGVGTGRTTPYFAPVTKEYVGFDYSEKMVAEAHRRFPDIRFEVLDATNMKKFPTGSFDFCFFSYNGIDVLLHEKRLLVLREVQRVGKEGGWFAFSSHNLQGVRKMFTIQLHRNPKRLWMSVRRYILTRLFNPSLSDVLRHEHTIINERAHFLRLKHYYIRPRVQVKQLHEEGFGEVRLFGLNGEEIPEEGWDSREDSWIYYLSRIHKKGEPFIAAE